MHTRMHLHMHTHAGLSLHTLRGQLLATDGKHVGAVGKLPVDAIATIVEDLKALQVWKEALDHPSDAQWYIAEPQPQKSDAATRRGGRAA